jgi:hypothetical protein
MGSRHSLNFAESEIIGESSLKSSGLSRRSKAKAEEDFNKELRTPLNN